MATIIKKGLSIYCALGGPYISPVIVPLINLINVISFPIFISCWVILIFSIFIPINFSGQNILNTSTYANNVKVKNPGKAFGISFAIYYIIMVSCMCVIMQSACKVNDSIPDFM
jgi:hypothetical protein